MQSRESNHIIQTSFVVNAVPLHGRQKFDRWRLWCCYDQVKFQEVWGKLWFPFEPITSIIIYLMSVEIISNKHSKMKIAEVIYLKLAPREVILLSWPLTFSQHCTWEAFSIVYSKHSPLLINIQTLLRMVICICLLQPFTLWVYSHSTLQRRELIWIYRLKPASAVYDNHSEIP